MRDITLGQYYATNSIVHRLDPRLKMLVTVLFMVAVFFVDRFFMFGVLLAIILTVIFIAKLPLLKVLKALRTILFLLLFSIALTLLFSTGTLYEAPLGAWWRIAIYQSALLNVGLLTLRLILLMLAPTILTLTTTPIELTDAIENLLKPLTLIKVPVYAFALIMSIALRMVPTLLEETDKIIAAQKARGADFESANILRRAKSMGAILIPLFISSFKRADDLADAMDSRCFRSAKRTRLKRLTFTWLDGVVLILAVTLLVVVLLFMHNWANWQWLESFRGSTY